MKAKDKARDKERDKERAKARAKERDKGFYGALKQAICGGCNRCIEASCMVDAALKQAIWSMQH